MKELMNILKAAGHFVYFQLIYRLKIFKAKIMSHYPQESLGLDCIKDESYLFFFMCVYMCV